MQSCKQRYKNKIDWLMVYFLSYSDINKSMYNFQLDSIEKILKTF